MVNKKRGITEALAALEKIERRRMVTFKLAEETDERLVYWYYPEGQEDQQPGIIVADLVKEEVRVEKLAEKDWEHDIPPEEINELVEAINEIRRELGSTDFEDPVTEAGHCIYYGDHAVSKIAESLQSGQVLKEGRAIWY